MAQTPDYLLVAAFERLDEERVFALVERGLDAGLSSSDILDQAREGFERVGALYQSGSYFLADLLMAAHIFKGVLQRLMDHAPASAAPGLPPVVFGTVQGDIHEIGKNLTIAFMRFAGLEVIDLGQDVPPQRFVEAVVGSGATVVCLSGLMTSCYGPMRRTVAALGKAGVRATTTVLIGGLVSETVRRHVGADFWTTDCIHGVELCREIVSGSRGSAAAGASGRGV